MRAIVVATFATGLACGRTDTPARDTATASTVAAASDTASVAAPTNDTAAVSTAVKPAESKAAVTKSAPQPATRTPRADSVKPREQAAPRTQTTSEPIPRVDTTKPSTSVVAPDTKPSSNADIATGKTVYEASCRKCHGAGGVPSHAMQARFPKLEAFNAAFFAKRSPDSVVAVLTKGAGPDMKSFKDKLSVAEMRAVDAYIRTFAP